MSAYHPQSNGLDERSNQTLKAQLQKLDNDRQDDWDELLPSILFSYRTSRHDSTKRTPFLLMYGREARLPIDLTRVNDTSPGEDIDFTTKVETIFELQKKAHDEARSNIEKQKKQYDAKHNSRTFVRVGDKVLVKFMRNEGRKGGKLEPQFPGGPYTVAEELGKGRYRLKDVDGRLLKTAVNCHRLKTWRDPDPALLKQETVSLYNYSGGCITFYRYF